MQLRLVLVSPKYQVNLGHIARVAKNFGIGKLHIVKPRASITGSQAIKYSKHAHELLENAVMHKTFDDAVKGCALVVGTTGIWRKAKSGFNNIYPSGEAAEYAKRLCGKRGTVALVLGRDDTGLSPEELAACDIVAYVKTNDAYPVLNISHAAAILLYAFTFGDFSQQYPEMARPAASEAELRELVKQFRKLITGKGVRDKKSVERVFRRVIKVSQPTKQEIHALITALK